MNMNFFQSIIDTTQDGFWLVGANGKILDVNAEYSTMSGYSKSELLEMSIPDFEARESEGDTTEHIRKIIEKGNDRFESTHRRKNGSCFDVEVSTTYLPKIDQLVSFIRDITKRKHAEAAYRKSEEQFRHLSDATFEAIVLHEDGIILHANEQYYEMFGYTPEELAGLDAISLTATSDSVNLIRHQISFGNMGPYEVVGLKKNGTEFPIEIQIKNLEFYSRKIRVAAIRDTTERRRVEKKLNFLSHVSRQVSSAMITTNKNFEINWTNAAFEKLYGYTQKEVIGKTPDFLNAEPFAEKFQDDIYRTVSSGKTWKGEALNKRKDGSIFPCEIEISPLVGETGEIFAYSGQQKDITERKQAEEALIKVHEELEKRVEERTRELKTTHDQLLHSEKLAAIGKLSASIAHEINNPLYGIQCVIEGIKRNFTLDEEYLKLSNLALSECGRIKDLIKSLQNFNKPSSGVKKATDIHIVLDKMLTMVKKEYKTASIIIKKQYAPDLPSLQVVQDQIQQVLLNLLANARDAIGDKSGAVTVTTENLGSEVAVRIRDTGSGISAASLPLIFEPFFTTKSDVKGTGLGLSISHGIIRGHGGDIEVDSVSGRGTTFSILLPVSLNNNEEAG